MGGPALRADWLGKYIDGGDAWEDGERSIHFTQTEQGVRFDWRCRYENNHGYEHSSALGRVVEVHDATITVVLTASKSSSWEDLFKEHLDEVDTTSEVVVIDILEVNDGKPILQYKNVRFEFAS